MTKKAIESKAIPLGNVHQNPLNPRRDYHLDQDNKDLLDMANSLQETGQHNPATVYEMLPEQPGEFMLLRGHRRHSGAILAGLDTLDCNIVEYPTSHREELEWLGSEDSLREDWGDFTRLVYAKDLAIEYNLPMSNPQMVSRTGLPKAKLEVGEAVFSLEPEIVEHVSEWEKWHYANKDKDKKGTAPVSSYRIKIENFTPERAALIYRIFESVRRNLPDMKSVSEASNLELQARIAHNCRYDKIRDLERTLSAVEATTRSARSGDFVAINRIVKQGESDGRMGKGVVAVAKNRYEQVLAKNIVRCNTTLMETKQIVIHVEDLGSDIELLQEAGTTYARLQLQLERASKAIDTRISQVRNR